MQTPIPQTFKQPFETSIDKPFNEFHISSYQNIQIDKTICVNTNNNFRVFLHQHLYTSFEELKKKLILQYSQLGYTDVQVEQENLWIATHKENKNSHISLLTSQKNEYIIEGIEVELINFLDELL